METQQKNGSTAKEEMALVLHQPQQLAGIEAYTPRTFQEALAIAEVLGKASGITREEAVLKMAVGAEYGIPATTALRMVDIIEVGGKKQPALRAQLIVGLCLRARGICEYFRFVRGDDTSATYVAKRVGEPEQEETYTIEQARKAKLVKTDGAWEKDPPSMLIARASSRLGRRVFPDVVGNLYTRDELEEAEARAGARDVTPLPAPVSALPAAKGPQVQDADVVEKESDEARIVRQLGEVKDIAGVGLLSLEAQKLWPQTRPQAIKDAHVAAKKRIAEAATGGAVKPATQPAAATETTPANGGLRPGEKADPTTGEVIPPPREPGEDDA